MGLYLIAATTWLDSFQTWGITALGLGMLIFVHELGHFVVAKLCGVKCEKFFLGFDIAGLKLFSLTVGETEYGIGILPLGGYVKMLGQNDNPANAEQERQRSKADPAAVDAPLDPRSYLAQSVPERMAIISAGVIMNLITAVLMASYAYHLGVEQMAGAISGTATGGPAWRANMRTGDRVLSINDQVPPAPLSFIDLKSSIVASTPGTPLRLHIERSNGELVDVEVASDDRRTTKQPNPTIGIAWPRSVWLVSAAPTQEGSAADQTDKLPVNCDLSPYHVNRIPQYQVVEINGQPVKNYGDVVALQEPHIDEPLTYTILKGTSEKLQGDLLNPERIEVTLPPTPLRHLGLTMTLGPITALQTGSPGEIAGLQVGDQILAINGIAVADPIDLPAQLCKLAGQATKLTVSTKGETREVEVTPREVSWEELAMDRGPLALSSLGVACQVLPIVAAVDPAGPAADKLNVGDRIREVTLTPELSKRCPDSDDDPAKPIKLNFKEDKGSWPGVMTQLQVLDRGSVTLVLENDRVVKLQPTLDPQRHIGSRGLNFMPELVNVQAQDWGSAFQLGLHSTKEASLTVYSFVRGLLSSRIDSTQLGGVVTIASQAAASVSGGMSTFLMFLTMLSANLAVINLLPIPVLDGGHLLFLIYEWIRGKAPNEYVQGALTWLGLGFVLFLILFTNGLDIVRLFGGLKGP